MKTIISILDGLTVVALGYFLVLCVIKPIDHLTGVNYISSNFFVNSTLLCFWYILIYAIVVSIKSKNKQ
jgi:hypothetical protein